VSQMARKYTGYDGDATGKQAGLEELVRQLCSKFPLWNNGTWVIRNMKNANLKTEKPSVHSTGRAADISWRKSGKKGSGNYADAVALMDFLVLHADALQIESIHDYFPQPFGRGWKCDRENWTVYAKPTIGSAPNGDWIHIEISPLHAKNALFYKEFFANLATAAGESPSPLTPAAGAPAPLVFAYPGKPLQIGSKGDAVKLVQALVGGVITDGDFGKKTDHRVKEWQFAHNIAADGIVGPVSWKAMFG
jgi:hypothetical protein